VETPWASDGVDHRSAMSRGVIVEEIPTAPAVIFPITPPGTREVF
jgi:hypothetical protein